MTRTRFRLILAASVLFALAILVFGCGGGGGGGGTTTSTTATTSTTSGSIIDVQLIGYVGATSTQADLSALTVNEQVEFKYVGVNSSTNQSVVVTGGALTSTAPATIATLTGNVLTVHATSNGTAYAVKGSYGGSPVTASYTTTTPQASVSGKVETYLSGAVDGAIVINFYNSSGVKVASTSTAADGTFVTTVPTTAVAFQVSLNGNNSFYSEYLYNNLNFSTSVASCTSSLPTVKVGVTTPLATTIFLYAISENDPPAPPDGCS